MAYPNGDRCSIGSSIQKTVGAGIKVGDHIDWVLKTLELSETILGDEDNEENKAGTKHSAYRRRVKDT